MQEQIVSFPPEANEKVGQYCIDHSVSLPGYFKEHKEYTEQNYPNPGISCSITRKTNLSRENGLDTSGSIIRLARQWP